MALSRKVKRVVAIRDGKISSERVLKEAYADRLQESNIDWRQEETQDEYAIVDRAGRVQIPAELLEELGLRDNKVCIGLHDGKVVISRPEAPEGKKNNGKAEDLDMRKTENGVMRRENPVIRADYPDPDVIRVGDVYYMLSSTLHFLPGGVILRSYDLLNWEIAGYVLRPLRGRRRPG